MKPKYQVGDRVKIRDELLYVSSDHPSRKYEGTVMTVRDIYTDKDGDLMCYRMEEDQDKDNMFGWLWYDCDIDGYAEDFEEPLDDSTFPEITFEQLLASTTLPQP